MKIRNYVHEHDYERVDRFLVEIYQPGSIMTAWLQPRWEYMHSLSLVDDIDLGTIGIVEIDGEIAGVIHPEHSPAFVYLQLRPDHAEAAPPLFDHAEATLGGMSQTLEKRVLGIYLSESDAAFGALLADLGFYRLEEYDEPQALFAVDGPIAVPPVPEGFALLSLDDDNDYTKINRALWRGFNHDGPPPPEEVAGRVRAQQTPNFNRSLTIVAHAPNGDYASFAGMWVVPENRVGYVEPVATDPDYRRMGLGAAAVRESMRRAGQIGAEVIWVGSDQEFYKSLGFEVTCRNRLWVKDL